RNSELLRNVAKMEQSDERHRVGLLNVVYTRITEHYYVIVSAEIETFESFTGGRIGANEFELLSFYTGGYSFYVSFHEGSIGSYYYRGTVRDISLELLNNGAAGLIPSEYEGLFR